MIIKTHSGAYVNTDVVAKYEVVPSFINRKEGEFTGTSRVEIDHFNVVVCIGGMNRAEVLGMYFNRKSAEEALDEAMRSLLGRDEFHQMTKDGMVDNMQPA